MLRVRINRKTQTARFQGPGTFQAKDEIKKLGAARWNSQEKCWEISSFNLSSAELTSLFPNAVVEDDEELPEQQAAAPAPAQNSFPGLPESYSVAEFGSKVRSLLQQAFPRTIFIRGVLCSVKKTKEGRIYMELAEAERAEERVNCVIWREHETICAKLNQAGFVLEPDLQVMFEARVDLNKRSASLSLSVVGIVAEYTVAKAAALREKTNERLKAEGLFMLNKSKRLPFLPRRLGLLTSTGGTVINDFRSSLDQAKFGFELFWVDSGVQGREAKQSLLRGLDLLTRVPELDAVLIFRGGGSAADLAVFNDYELAKAVCLFPLPVLSAIGHQEDQCSIQDVSSLAFGVPKDLGHYLANLVKEQRRGAARAARVVRDCAAAKVSLGEQRLADLTFGLRAVVNHRISVLNEALSRLVCSLPLQAVRAAQQTLTALSRFISGTALAQQLCVYREREAAARWSTAAAFASTLARSAEEKINSLERLVNGASPEVQLRRGFTLVRRPNSSGYLTRAEQTRSDEEVEIDFQDGTVGARLKDKGSLKSK